MKIKYKWAMPSRRTFTIKPIKKLLKKYCGPVPGLSHAVDPFQFPYKEDALTYLKSFKNETVKLLLLDPPYSKNQLKVSYSNKGIPPFDDYLTKIKNEASRILAPGGIVISFGWSSNGLGKKRGVTKIELLVVAHGGQHYDTLVIVEKKNPSLKEF
jgi:hypothetical protein